MCVLTENVNFSFIMGNLQVRGYIGIRYKNLLIFTLTDTGNGIESIFYPFWPYFVPSLAL